MTIFEIEKELLEVMELLEQNEGEITDEITEKLNVNRNELEDKLSQYNYITIKIKSEIQTGIDEVNRINSILLRKSKSLQSLATYSQKAIELYGLEVSNSKAKNKPKEVKLKNDVRAVLSFSESIELDKDIRNNTTDNFPKDLIPYSRVDYTMKLMLNDYNKFKEQIDNFFNDIINQEAFAVTTIAISTNKTNIKKAMDEGIEFENASISLKSKIEFK